MGSDWLQRGGACAHVAVLLAAGGSTRLGQPKQLLTRNGVPLVRCVARLLLETSPRELLVVLGAHHEPVAHALVGVAHRAVLNEDWEEGLASSLRVAGAAVAADRVLIAVCDQPALQHMHLVALLGATSPCAATDHHGRPGVPAVADAHVWRQAGTLRGDRGFARLFEQRDDVACFDFPELGHDIDTPADLAEARLRGWID